VGKQTKTTTTRLRMFNQKPPLDHPADDLDASLYFPLSSLWATAHHGQQWEAQHALSDEHHGLCRTTRPITSQASKISHAECGRHRGDRLLGRRLFYWCYKRQETVSLPSRNWQGGERRKGVEEVQDICRREQGARPIVLRLEASGVPFGTPTTLHFRFYHPDEEHWFVATG